jgi:hypothetical protein
MLAQTRPQRPVRAGKKLKLRKAETLKLSNSGRAPHGNAASQATSSKDPAEPKIRSK